ncbi:hypothetical protein BpHYR1_034688 [Brachionus plicatilis]|uniref:Uncharacterized protein n=1 Tax=Brachionus plicatilis TaxID=10195 RepID=A0A3M7SHQ5_BRAPC|nr:hypothetical protein BpHYR1_034688 [Brachionus plicatilis]
MEHVSALEKKCFESHCLPDQRGREHACARVDANVVIAVRARKTKVKCDSAEGLGNQGLQHFSGDQGSVVVFVQNGAVFPNSAGVCHQVQADLGSVEQADRKILEIIFDGRGLFLFQIGTNLCHQEAPLIEDMAPDEDPGRLFRIIHLCSDGLYFFHIFSTSFFHKCPSTMWLLLTDTKQANRSTMN